MAGDEADFWKKQLEANGISVAPIIRGLGEVDAWVNVYVHHLKVPWRTASSD